MSLTFKNCFHCHPKNKSGDWDERNLYKRIQILSVGFAKFSNLKSKLHYILMTVTGKSHGLAMRLFFLTYKVRIIVIFFNISKNNTHTEMYTCPSPTRKQQGCSVISQNEHMFKTTYCLRNRTLSHLALCPKYCLDIYANQFALSS